MKKIISIPMFVFAFVLVFDAGAQVTSQTKATQFDTPPEIDFDTIPKTPRWFKGGIAGVTMSQVSLSNWAAGGEGSSAFDLMLNYEADYAKDRNLWQNRLELAYGLNTTDSKGTRKSNDRIYLSSMYSYRLSRTWYASALAAFSSQFAKGYNYATTPKTYMSRFMAPGYLTLGVGFTWKPNSWFSAYISPATWRGTLVLDKSLFNDAAGNPVYTVYGVKPGKKLYNEFGANARLEVDHDIWRNVHLYSRLDLFSNYLDKPQNIDVRWYTMLTAKFNRWLSASVSFNAIYDDNVKFPRPDGTPGPSKLQFKEVLGIGLQVAF